MREQLSTFMRILVGGQGDTPDDANRVFPTTIQVEDRRVYTTVTSLYNVLASALGLFILSPLMITIAIAVKLTSRGPALYRGERVGLNERIFKILKFRTMHVGSEAKIGQRLVQQDENHFTSIGQFLRKYRLDELPQLINVLKRDMNLVGPRPVRPIFLKNHKRNIPGYHRRFAVRPGITGQAQIRGGYYTSPRHKLFYEMLHISRRDVLFDLQLIVLTFARVMTRIFTTTLLLCWLLVMVFVAPPEFTAAMNLSVGGVTFNVLYLVPTLIAIAHLSHRRLENRRVVAMRTPTDLPLIGLLVWALLAVPISPFPMEALRGVGWWVCNGVVVLYLVMNSRMVTDRRDTLVSLLVAGTTMMSLVEVVPTLLNWFQTGVFERVLGPLLSPAMMTAITVLALPLATSRSLRADSTSSRVFFRVCAVCLGLATLLTLSRLGLLAMTVAVTMVLWSRRKRLIFAIVLVVVATIVGLAISGDTRMRPSNAWSELKTVVHTQSYVISELGAHPDTDEIHRITGVGGRVVTRMAMRSWDDRKAQGRPQLVLNNMFLTILVEFGVVGFLLFALFIIRTQTFMLSRYSQISDEDARGDLLATAAGVCAASMLFLISDCLYELPIILGYFAALGLGIGLAAHYSSEPKRVWRIIQYRHQL